MSLQIKNLSFGYKKNQMILNNINLEIKQGEILGILGPNGTGKTTFIKCINNIHKPNEGRILYDGNNIMNLSDSEYKPLE